MPLPIAQSDAGQYSALEQMLQHPPLKGRKHVQDLPHSMTAQDALVALMIAVSASDEDIRTAELVKIQSAVNMLPVFADFDLDRLNTISQIVFDLFEQEDGLDALFGLVREALPERLNETAYALACDVAAADGSLDEAELRLLEEMRYELNIDRLHAAAIERGARARHLT
jgi:tellurite resistance protein